MPAIETVDFVEPSVKEEKDFWSDVKAVCDKHNMVLGTGFSIQKAVKVGIIEKKDVS